MLLSADSISIDEVDKTYSYFSAPTAIHLQYSILQIHDFYLI